MSHTPGPWSRGQVLQTARTMRWTADQWDRAELKERRTIFANSRPEDEGRGRIIVASVVSEHPEAPHDARLIAAAPEMLEALKGVWTAHDQFDREPILAALRKVRAVIAKVRDEEKGEA